MPIAAVLHPVRQPDAFMKLLHVYYDFRVAPLTFDFTIFLAAAVAKARRADAKISMNLFRPYFRRINPIERGYSPEYMEWRFSNIIVRLCELCPDIVSININRTNNIRLDAPIYPVDYHPLKVNVNVGKTQIPVLPVDLERETLGAPAPTVFKSTGYAREWALRRMADKPTVVATIREAAHNSGRNTPQTLWTEVAEELAARGYQVLMIPDQDVVLSKSGLDSHATHIAWEAALDLDLRIALYETAALTMSWSGGAGGGLLPFCDSRFVVFGVWNEANPVSNRAYLVRKGMPIGSQPSWLNPETQYYDWVEHNALSTEHVVATLEKWLPDDGTSLPADNG